MDLTDAQWAVLEPLFRPKRRADGRGRPWRDTRAVLNGVFWVLHTGAPWHDLPSRYPSYQTCHRRFQHWQRGGLLTRCCKAVSRPCQHRVCSKDRRRLHSSEEPNRKILKQYGILNMYNLQKAEYDWARCMTRLRRLRRLPT